MDRDAAAIQPQLDLVPRIAADIGNCVDNALLVGMLQPVIAVQILPQELCAGQHPRMFSAAIVVDRKGRFPPVLHALGDILLEGVVRPTLQIALIQADLLKNAGERVLLGLLPIVDDFERGLAAAEADTSAEAVRQGMELIYNKLMKYLESQGVKPMESNGATFDADYFEAIATIPAPSEDLKGKVIDTTQKGYMLNDKVLRHAKVAVGE